MTTQQQLIAKYGNPLESHEAQLKFEREHMILWDIPQSINAAIPALPNKMFVNIDAVIHLEEVFKNLMFDGLSKEIITFDGGYNPRYQRGSKTVISIHSWATAWDFNAAHNPFMMTREQAIAKGLKPFTEAFDKIWRDHGFTCGIDFKKRKDGMHFELTQA